MNHGKHERFSVGIITPMIYFDKVDLIETSSTSQRIEHITCIVIDHLTLYRPFDLVYTEYSVYTHRRFHQYWLSTAWCFEIKNTVKHLWINIIFLWILQSFGVSWNLNLHFTSYPQTSVIFFVFQEFVNLGTVPRVKVEMVRCNVEIK